LPDVRLFSGEQQFYNRQSVLELYRCALENRDGLICKKAIQAIEDMGNDALPEGEDYLVSCLSNT
jgi:hypothetical protein